MDTTKKMNTFEIAQQQTYPNAISEIKQGQKRTHWMWYIFPQIYGLGKSEIAKQYAICSSNEAKAFIEHNILGNNLRDICNTLLNLQTTNAVDIFGEIDAIKLKSSMTLFDAIQPNNVYSEVLNKFFNGERDHLTLCRIMLESRIKNALNFIGIDAKDFNITPNMYTSYREKPTHRFSHIYRVMIGTAFIAHKINEPRLGLLAFIAAFIHDLARLNDGSDHQHGRRAAETKLPKLTHLLSKYQITPNEYDMIAKATTYHCEHMQGHISSECFTVCKILSDADALDRCRFHSEGARLNVRLLHFQESKKCIAPVDFICKESVRQNKIQTEIPFEEFIKVAIF